jgi:tRNA threonylcarbamoyladenosine biosynthesis protein TsaB
LVKVLGLDCTGGACSAAVLAGGRVLAARFAVMERGQSEALMPMIATVLDEAALDLSALDLLAVTCGPGSFTGVRTGLAAARGLTLASGLPLLGVTSFDAVAEAVAGPDRAAKLVVALESRRVELFLQRFDGASAAPPALVAAEDWAAFAPAGAFAVAGDGARRFAAGLQRDDAEILGADPVDAVHVARLAGRRWQPGTRPPAPAPLYLRAPDTSVAPRS